MDGARVGAVVAARQAIAEAEKPPRIIRVRELLPHG